MSEKLEVIVGATTYDLSDFVNLTHLKNSGFGMAPVKQIAENGPMQHGVSYVGFRLQPRKLGLVLLLEATDEADYWEQRNRLLRIFKPHSQPIYLRHTAGDRVRQIDCYYDGELDLGSDGRMLYAHQVPVALFAPDPTWYDPDGASHVFMLGGGQAMNVPLAVPWQVGASAIDQSIVVAYAGSWDAYPTILIDGPVTGLLVQNNTLGDKLDFTGVTIPAGETYVIDCRYGYKTVIRQSDGANRIQDLTADSNLATFRVGAHPEPLDGVNSLRVKGTGITAGTRVVIQYKPRYVGV